MEKLKTFIESYVKLTESDWLIIQHKFRKNTFERDEIILKPGATCKHFYFLESGLLRFFYDIDGNDVTKTFVVAPYVFTSKTSFRKQEPADEGIEALEKTIVWQTSSIQYNHLAKLDSWNVFIRKILNEIQEFSENLLLESKTKTAEERYNKLLNEYPPEILRKIPLKHLSTYLGIAPQSLSRIRKKPRHLS